MAKYKELLKMAKEAIDDMQIPYKVRKAKHHIDGEILSIEKQISDYNLKIVEAKSEHPIDFNKIIEQIDARDLAQRKLNIANELKDELFD